MYGITFYATFASFFAAPQPYFCRTHPALQPKIAIYARHKKFDQNDSRRIHSAIDHGQRPSLMPNPARFTAHTPLVGGNPHPIGNNPPIPIPPFRGTLPATCAAVKTHQNHDGDVTKFGRTCLSVQTVRVCSNACSLTTGQGHAEVLHHISAAWIVVPADQPPRTPFQPEPRL